MRKISGQLISSKPVSLSRAAKHINQFAAVENGSSVAVTLYLQRTADAFNHLVQFRKRSKNGDVEKRPGRKRARKLETESLKKNPEEKTEKKSKNRERIFNEATGANPSVEEQIIPDEEVVKGSKVGRKKGKGCE